MTKNFWEKEYKNPTHLAISEEPSGDLENFVRWAVRNSDWPPFPQGGLVVDVGCGNGRNIIALCEESGMKGEAFDISNEAIAQAKKKAREKNLTINFSVRNAGDFFPLLNESTDVVLDMMVSHFLNEKERASLYKEIARIVKPFGWFYFKTFILDGDLHARRLIDKNPSGEFNTYIHPKIKVAEHVFTEEEIIEIFSPSFVIHKMIKSYKHIKDGEAHKRRTVSVYMERRRDDND